MKNLEALDALLRRGPALVFIPTLEERYALSLVRQAGVRFYDGVWLWSSVGGLREAMTEKAPAVEGTMNAGAALVHWRGLPGRTVVVMLDVCAHLSDPLVLRALREACDGAGERGSSVVLIDHADALPGVLEAAAERFEVALPDDEELEQIVVRELKRHDRQDPVRLKTDRAGIRAVARAMRGLTREQAARAVFACIGRDRRFELSDIATVNDVKKRLLGSGSPLETVEAPAELADIGGMERLKAWVRRRGAALDAASPLPPPRGVLILGVQGAGKSLCAKAIAASWQRPLLRLDPGVLYDRYIGESERRLREALRVAEAMAPAVLWIDEIEKGFASAAGRSNDGGLSQRMFGALLTWMQEHRAAVFIAATANDIEALPPELLRKGRFDEIFFVDLPAAAERAAIFGIHLRRRGLEPARFDLEALTGATGGFSGAEIEQCIVAAMYDRHESGGAVDTTAIVEAARRSPPLSVTMAERIEALRRWARGRCVPASDQPPAGGEG